MKIIALILSTASVTQAGPLSQATKSRKKETGCRQEPCLGSLLCAEADGWELVPKRGKCIKRFSWLLNYDEAKTACKEEAPKGKIGALISISDSETVELAKYLMSFAPAYGGDHWTGGYLSGGKWYWGDGSNWSNENWSPNEPNNHKGVEDKVCIRADGKFNDCTTEKEWWGSGRPFLCQYK